MVWGFGDEILTVVIFGKFVCRINVFISMGLVVETYQIVII